MNFDGKRAGESGTAALICRQLTRGTAATRHWRAIRAE
jgi:hypothetical protein